MIARVEFGYATQAKFKDLAQSEEIYKLLRAMLPEAPEPENKDKDFYWPRESLIELETDGRWLVDHGISFEVKKFKGTMTLKATLPDGQGTTNIYVQVPHVGLLAIEEVTVEEDCCTDLLQRRINEGWRILCVCPPNAARRPDYVLGRTKERE